MIRVKFDFGIIDRAPLKRNRDRLIEVHVAVLEPKRETENRKRKRRYLWFFSQ